MSGYPGGGYPGAPGGGYPPAGGAGYPGAAPAVDPNVAQWFRAVDQDNSGQIDATELGQALANGDMSMFSEEACRMMISMFDTNQSNTIGMDEFGRLFNYINEWKRMFESYDREKQGTLSQEDLNQALQSIGYRYGDIYTVSVLSSGCSSGSVLSLSRTCCPSTVPVRGDSPWITSSSSAPRSKD